MPFSWYGPLPDACTMRSGQSTIKPGSQTRRTSIEPAMSMCAHRMDGSSAPSAGSTPSTKDLRKSAAVQHPARVPPVYGAYAVRASANKAMKHEDGGGRTLQRSALDE